MKIGVVFPQNEIGADVGAIRAYARGAEDLGYGHLLAYDHVVGADPAVHIGWDGHYDVHATFHEPMVLFGFLAAATDLELASTVLVLPQRQTALVAKQAAEADILCGGHFRLGVGVGWNSVEYDALGQDFVRRGARLEEQVTLLRRLWSEQSVSYEGEFDRLVGVGLAPMPIQRPIPLWFGGRVASTYRRIGRLGDGWFPSMQPGGELRAAQEMIRDAAGDAGRDPSAIGMEGRVHWANDLDAAMAGVDVWRGAGASHVSINTMGAGFADVDGHLGALGQVAAALGLGAKV